MICSTSEPDLVVSLLQAQWPFSVFPFLYTLLASLNFFILHQSLNSVAWCAIQCNDLGAGRAHRLRTHWTLGGNANLKYFMDGLPETVEVVIYQSYESQKNRTDD